MKKKIFFGLSTVAVAVVAIVACKKNVHEGTHGTFAGSPLPTATLPTVITSDRTLVADTLYLLDGKTYVSNGADLFIDPGTHIEGITKPGHPDSASALIITRGSTITAEGDVSNPIVFSSHAESKAPGDWGGIVILGKASLNRADTTIEGIGEPNLPVGVDINYGGGTACSSTFDNESSGTLRYVRIEYAGAVITEGNELNGLTLGGVGRGTVLDYIQVSYGADDGFEFFGGTVCATHLISFGNNDDDFDFDFGYNGTIQFAVGSKVPDLPYSPNPNGIESDNNPGTTLAGCRRTQVTLSNLTIIGTDDASEAINLPASGGKGLLNGAIYRQFSSMFVRNSIIMGYPIGVRLQTAETQADAGNINYNLVHGFTEPDTATNPLINPFTLNNTNTRYKGASPAPNSSILLTNPYLATPDYRPATGSPALGTADFTSFTSVCGLTTVTYRGAFAGASVAGSNWMEGWTNFNL